MINLFVLKSFPTPRFLEELLYVKKVQLFVLALLRLLNDFYVFIFWILGENFLWGVGIVGVCKEYLGKLMLGLLDSDNSSAGRAEDCRVPRLSFGRWFNSSLSEFFYNYIIKNILLLKIKL